MRSQSREPSVRASTTPERHSVSYQIGANRSIPSQNPQETPQMDARARYSISYVPRLSEHNIETGKTLLEAQFKVILLSCEVERLSTINYKLVKENEIFRVQSNKGAREKDLETKLAIVLAENEKLNQIIEEITTTYPQDNDDSRVQELIRDLEDWKLKYSVLESSQPVNNETQLREKALVQENEMRDKENQALRERLNDSLGKIIQYEDALKAHKDEIARLNKIVKEMEDALTKAHGLDQGIDAQNPYGGEEKAKRSGAGASAEKNKALAEEILKLRNENQLLRPEAELARDLQNQLANTQNDNKRILDALQKTQGDNDNLRKIIDQLRPNQGNIEDLNRKIKILSDDNSLLSNENLDLRKKISDLLDANRIIDDLNSRIKIMAVDNQKIAENLTDKIRENERLFQMLRELQDSAHQLDDLRTKLVLITQENERLNVMISDKIDENEGLKQRISELLLTAANAEQLANRVRVLVDQIQKTQEESDHKSQDIERLLKRIEDLEKQNGEVELYKRQIVTLNQDIEAYKRRILDLEASNFKIKELMDELQRMKNIIAIKNQEITELKNRIAELEKLKTQQAAMQDENKKLKEAVAVKMAEINDVFKVLNQMQANQANVVGDLGTKIKNLINTIN